MLGATACYNTRNINLKIKLKPSTCMRSSSAIEFPEFLQRCFIQRFRQEWNIESQLTLHYYLLFYCSLIHLYRMQPMIFSSHLQTYSMLLPRAHNTVPQIQNQNLRLNHSHNTNFLHLFHFERKWSHSRNGVHRHISQCRPPF